MKFSKINFSCFSEACANRVTKQIAAWLGRLWKTCTQKLAYLIARINQAAHRGFIPIPQTSSKNSSHQIVSLPTSSVSPPLLKLIKDTQKKSELENQLIEEEAAIEKGSSEKPIPLESLSQNDKLEENSPLSLEVKKKEDELKENEEQLKLEKVTASTLNLSAETQKLEQTVTKQVPAQPEMFKRPRRIRQIRQQETQKTPVELTPASSAPKVAEKNKKEEIPRIKIKIIDAGGGGNCLLLSFLKGLELQYPDLFRHEVQGKSVNYTATEIRRKGVEFVRDHISKFFEEVQTHTKEKIDNKLSSYNPDQLRQLVADFAYIPSSPSINEILGYLDADRKEYNESHSQLLESLKKKLATLEEQKAKIKPAYYEKSKKNYTDDYNKTLKNLQEKVFIHDDETFLKRLEEPGFFCSTLHLLALSLIFQIPIHVREQYGVRDHKIQVFNPLNSENPPIHLYRVGNIHYKFLLYPTNQKK